MFRGIAIDGGRGGEDDVVDVVFLHAAEKGNGSANVDAIVLERNFCGFTNRLAVGKYAPGTVM